MHLILQLNDTQKNLLYRIVNYLFCCCCFVLFYSKQYYYTYILNLSNFFIIWSTNKLVSYTITCFLISHVAPCLTRLCDLIFSTLQFDYFGTISRRCTSSYFCIYTEGLQKCTTCLNASLMSKIGYFHYVKNKIVKFRHLASIQ